MEYAEAMSFLLEGINKEPILSMWNEYTKFIEKPNIPFPNNIEFKFTLENPNGYTNDSSVSYIGDGKFEFFIRQKTMRNKVVMFHEFTHIMDLLVINKPEDIDNFLKTYNAISETRAEYLSYLFNAGLTNISDEEVVPYNKILAMEQDTVENVILSRQKEMFDLFSMLEDIKSLDDTDLINKLNLVLKGIQYYLGFCLFIEYHTDISVNNENILKKASQLFGDYIYNVFDISDDISLSMDETDMELANDYYNAFKICSVYFCSRLLPDIIKKNPKVIDMIISSIKI